MRQGGIEWRENKKSLCADMGNKGRISRGTTFIHRRGGGLTEALHAPPCCNGQPRYPYATAWGGCAHGMPSGYDSRKEFNRCAPLSCTVRQLSVRATTDLLISGHSHLLYYSKVEAVCQEFFSSFDIFLARRIYMQLFSFVKLGFFGVFI